MRNPAPGLTAPDLPLLPDKPPTMAHDDEYVYRSTIPTNIPDFRPDLIY